MPVTDEQNVIIGFKPTPGSIVSVQAYAGSGKTFTLKEFADANPSLKILYIVFNKAIKDDAKKKFPKNVECKTSHGLAVTRYKHFAHKYRQFISVSEYRAMMGEDDWRVVKLAINGLTHFMNSDEHESTTEHVLKDLSKTDKISQSRLDQALRAAKRTWQMQSDPLNDAYCSPNTILKLFQLSNPALDQFYNVILFDESQDANPVTIDIVLRNNCCKVFVGDQHQVINRWRGAENALEIVEDHGAQVMRLTKSFRFGPLVAALANVVLSMKGETFPLVGLGSLDAIVEPSAIQDQNFYAIISRTYMGVIQSAYESIMWGKRVMWNGGISKYRLDELLDLHALKTGNIAAIKNNRITTEYGNWANFLEIAETTKDVDMVRAIKLMEVYADIPGMVETMRMNEARTEKEADLIVTTAHTSKGKEFDHVIINDDFPSIIEAVVMKKPREVIIDELNLLYVTITRTKKSVNINTSLMELLEEYRSRIERNVSVVII